MPSLADHQSADYTKCLIIGDSKSGKTGALASLVAEGYKLRILDFDNGLDVLKQYVLRDCPDKIGNIEYRTIRDKRKATPGGSIVERPTAFVEGIKMLDRWKYKHDGQEIDLGVPSTWGPECILVIDSLSRFCDAAFDWAGPMTVGYGTAKFDPRAQYKTGQDAIIEAMATLTGESFECNVIVIAHIRYLELPDGTKKGFPQSIGSAIATEIPQYFNSYAMFENNGGKRTLRTTSTPLIDLANPKPFAMEKSYPIETGLAQFFRVLRESPKPKGSPKLVSDRRA